MVNDDLWKTYHHHVERFYDFVYLNKELRDRDFKHNYQEKLKIVEKAEQLSEDLVIAISRFCLKEEYSDGVAKNILIARATEEDTFETLATESPLMKGDVPF